MYCRRFKKCCCMNNMCNNEKEEIEDKCDNICSCNDYDKDDCGCGFDEEYGVFPENPMLAQSYVPMQFMDRTFKPCKGLEMGTIFPELVSPYYPNLSVEQIAFIEATNKIGEGCNKCN